MNKPGYLTTEFWVTIVLGGLTMLTALGVIGPSEGDFVRGHIQQWATVATAVIAFGYQLSRAIAKHHWAQAAALIEGELSQAPVNYGAHGDGSLNTVDGSAPDGL